MPSKFERVPGKPGIYRRGRSFYASVTSDGITKKIRAGTKQKDAENLKRDLESARDRGQDIAARREREKLVDYAHSWIATYSGRGSEHITEKTRADYRRDLDKHVLPWFGSTQIGRIRPRTLDELVAHLQNKTDLADSTIVRVLVPLRACLADAYRLGDIAGNPAAGLRVRRRPKVIEADDERAKVISRVQLAALVDAVDPRWRPLIELLAGSGLRINEALALRWRDLDLGSRPSVRVVRAIKGGQPLTVGPPKSKASRRVVPLPSSVADQLRLRKAKAEKSHDDDLVFPSARGTLMSDDNLRRRVFDPAARAAGCSWASFHTLRHVFASVALAEGRNVVQVQRLLGHADPAITLSTYLHLMDNDVGGPVDLDAALGRERPTELVALG